MRLILIISILLFSNSGFSQEFDPDRYNPRIVDRPTIGYNNFRREYRWPYFYDVPLHFGLLGGYEGFKSHYWTAGGVFNLVELTGTGTGGYVGTTFLYKQHFSEGIKSYEAEIGMYAMICMGLNFNYRTQGEEYATFGVRPFIGLALFNFQLIWGYNIYSDKRNSIVPLRHGSWELRYVIPLIKLSKGSPQPSFAHYPDSGYY
jgi:hypothetical protein